MLTLLGRFAMADVFLIAIYIVAAKGVGVGRLETGWGLYLFTFCVLLSYAVALGTKVDAKNSPNWDSTAALRRCGALCRIRFSLFW